MGNSPHVLLQGGSIPLVTTIKTNLLYSIIDHATCNEYVLQVKYHSSLSNSSKSINTQYIMQGERYWIVRAQLYTVHYIFFQLYKFYNCRNMISGIKDG